MHIPLRPIIGFGAGATAMALVLFAGLTAPPADSDIQLTSKCPDAAKESGLLAPIAGAQSPA